MSYGKFRFKDMKEFQSIQVLADKNGIETTKEFNNFLKENYNHLLKD